MAHSRGRRLVPFGITNTLWPDGTALRGVPEDRPDLAALGEKLERTPSIEHSGDFSKPCAVVAKGKKI